MKKPEKPAKPKTDRKRGRPADSLAMTQDQAIDALDRMLGKKPKAEPPTDGPKVRSKKR